MLNNFQLAAIVKQSTHLQLQRIPMHQALQKALAATWEAQLDAFLDETKEIPFDVGYQPERHERFVLLDFDPPAWLASEASTTIAELEALRKDDALISAITGIVAFARDQNGKELVLFQNFSRSHVIRPTMFLFLIDGTYQTIESPGLTLDSKLAAVYFPAEKKVLFNSFRTVNTFLPLGDFYEEASEQQIREVLSHDKLAPVNVDAFATDSNQWFRKRFAMLRDSSVLDQYSARQIQTRSKGYDVEIKVTNGKIVFPEDRPAAKKLLQFLNEELFKGAITETLFETNSKREAD